MIKNDINLIQKRKNKQYSSKSLILTVGIVVIVGVGVVLGITLPTQNLADTKAAVIRLDDELQQYSGIALTAGGTTTETDIPPNAGLDTIYIAKTKQLKTLEEQLESLVMISTAESNALAYINAIEESIPSEVNLTSLSMIQDNLSINGTASGDTALATFCLRLKEAALFEDVFVSSSMVMLPGETTTVFNLTVKLSEPLDALPVMQNLEDNAETPEVTDEGI